MLSICTVDCAFTGPRYEVCVPILELRSVSLPEKALLLPAAHEMAIVLMPIKILNIRQCEDRRTEEDKQRPLAALHSLPKEVLCGI